MNYKEAENLLNNGRKVRLPEWTGYWFKDGDAINVFTRTGEVLDTPNVDAYKNRNDWQTAGDGLGFDFAIIALKAGKRLARLGWNGKDMYIYKTVGNTVTKDFIPKFVSLPPSVKEDLGKRDADVVFKDMITMFTAQGEMQPGWLASQTDMLAEDWIVVS